MYAKDNKIINLPNRLKNASMETLEKLNIFPIEPFIPQEGKQRGALYLDGKVYKYKVIEAQEVDPYETFDTYTANKAIFNAFSSKCFMFPNFRSHTGMISKLVDVKGFNDLNRYTQIMLQMGDFTQDEYNQFLAIFAAQEIDLTTYTNF